MKSISLALAISCASLFCVAAQAQATADQSAAFTATCKDGSSFSGAAKKGACAGHKGVQTWLTKAGKPVAAKGAATPAAATTTAATAAPAAAAVTPAATAKPAKAAATNNMAPAAGGGPGQVWVNEKTKVYHCPGDKYYGKTKEGAYMSEADATAKGYHADHGKACK